MMSAATLSGAHRQSETRLGAVVMQEERIAIEVQCARERLDRLGQVLEGVGIEVRSGQALNPKPGRSGATARQ
jgi:hypothetical protein